MESLQQEGEAEAELVDQLSLIDIPTVKDAETEGDLWYKKLLGIGSRLPGDSHDINTPITNSDIPWYDPKLIQEGKDFVQRHWFAVFLAHFMSLIVGAALKPGISVMLRTGLSHKRENSLKRYLSTTLHVRTWYDSETPEVIRDMQKVRRLHAKAVKTFHAVPIPLEEIKVDENQLRILHSVQSDIKDVPGPNKVFPLRLNSYEPEQPISQLALVMTQYCFMGFVVLFPKAFGIHETRGMDGFRHLWAVLGKYLGIEDEFNLGLQKDTRLLRRIFDEISVPGLKESDEATMVFWDAITYGVKQYRPFFTLNSLLLFMTRDLIGVSNNGRNLIKLMSWYDLFCYQALHFLCSYLLQWNLIRWITNKETRSVISFAKQKYM